MNLHEINEQVLNGEKDALEAYIELKKIADTATAIMKEIKPDALTEADKYDGKTFQAFGAQIEKRNGGGVWSFKHLQDWNEINKKKKEVEDLHKTAYKLKGQEAIINPDTGEIIEPAEYKPNADTISIKIL